jgi:hypothetical protein
MMDDTLWKQWNRGWEWIMGIAQRRNWQTRSLEIKPPVDITDIILLEENLNVRYPAEFKYVLANYASAVSFYWQMENEAPDEEFKEIFCGAGRGYLWDFTTLKDDFEAYKGWVEQCFSNPNDEYDKIWHNKVPFLDVPNGDMIVFDTSESEDNCPIIYLSHDGSDFHGHRLAGNFIDFITCWSNIGCVGTEDWQLEPFYDYDTRDLKASDPKIDRWKQWLSK